MKQHRMRLSRAHFAPSGPETRLASAHFSLSLRKAASAGGCAVVVSKKVARLSVTRHLLKRRVFSVIRPHCLSDRALILYARPGAAALSFQDLETELRELMARAFPALS